MYAVKPTTKFQKDLKRIQKRGYDLSLLTQVIKMLAAGIPLPEKNRDSFPVRKFYRVPRVPHYTGLVTDL